MIGPLFLNQISPVTLFGTHSVKSCEGVALKFAYDVIGEPKMPRRAIIALIPESEYHLDTDALFPILPEYEFHAMQEESNDSYFEWVIPRSQGYFYPIVYAWVDEIDRLMDLARRKGALGEPFETELLDVVAVLDAHLQSGDLLSWGSPEMVDTSGAVSSTGKFSALRRECFEEVIAGLTNSTLSQAKRLSLLEGPAMKLFGHLPRRLDLISGHIGQRIRVERERAGFSSWYELFPRSFGGFKNLDDELLRIASLGFDTVYFPPIHPIGVIDRKGRNNSLVATADDVGSPWAIGSSLGGHTAVHPELGNENDLIHLVDYAAELGLEIAIDIALQCAPDHPWVTEHPDWFVHRSNGEIAFAENPPKKYQDIYPIDFYVQDQRSRSNLWEAIYAIFEHWISLGINIFRVDNPHTKGLSFWEWICEKLADEYPAVILLAEAFTVPKLMYKLAEIGFSQSYTYFTWRTSKEELINYGLELASLETVATMRPNFWPNTPDILAHPLRNGTRQDFLIRATLAATMTTSWGIYSGFELCENTPVVPDSEEYLNSEKYQLRKRDFASPDSLDEYIVALNAFRKENSAFRAQDGFINVATDSDDVLAYVRFNYATRNRVLVVVNLSPQEIRECQLDLEAIRAISDGGDTITVRDVLRDEIYVWSTPRAYVRLDPAYYVAHLCEFI